jgi:hypothetical protein
MCGCQFNSEPCVWIDSTMPTVSSGSSSVARTKAVAVRAATRARSPRSFRRRKYGRSRLGTVNTICRWGTGARSSSPSHSVHSAKRFAWQLGQK